MATFCTQFHALPSELIAFVETWMDTYPIIATAVEFPPVHAICLKRDDISGILSRPMVRRVIFTLGNVDLSGGDNVNVMAQHPGALALELGHLVSRGLEESCLSTMDANPIWRKINNDLKRKATTGADFLHEENGARGVERTQRFTPGARALSSSGTPLRPDAQSPMRFLPK